MHANGITRRPARWVTLALAGALALVLSAMGGTALAKDRNNDDIADRWEKRHDLSLKVDQANRDQDSDEMPNLGEFEGGTDPRDEDTDGDGVPDADENAGEVASFTPGVEEGTGTLEISLYSGEALFGEVTEDTTIALLSEEDEESLATAARPGAPPSFGGGEESEVPAPGEEAEPDVQTGPSADSGPGGRPGRDVGQGDCPGATEGSVDDLVPGAVIHQATLDVTANGKEFRRIEVASSE